MRAKLAKDAATWKWSSHGEYVGRVRSDLTDKVFPLSLFHEEMTASGKLYERFVRDGIETGHNEEFYPSLSNKKRG